VWLVHLLSQQRQLFESTFCFSLQLWAKFGVICIFFVVRLISPLEDATKENVVFGVYCAASFHVVYVQAILKECLRN